MKTNIGKKTGALLLCAALLAATPAGCKPSAQSAQDIVDKLSGASSSAEVASEPEASEPEEEPVDSEEAFTAKYNAYIGVNNFMLDRLETVVSSYFRRVQLQEEFAMQENTTDFWCNSIADSQIEDLDETHELSSQQPAIEGLDAAYESLYPVLKELSLTFNEIYQYGDLKKYQDDNYEGARQLHEKLFPLYAQYIDLANAFLDEMEVVADEQNAKMAEYYKEQGLIAHYTFNQLIDKAQDLQAAIYEQGVYDDNLLELDLEALQPLYDEFSALVDETLAITDEQVQEEGGFITSIFFSNVTDVRTSLSDLFQRVREQRPLDSWEVNSTFPSSGTIREFEQKLSDLIDSYNGLW